MIQRLIKRMDEYSMRFGIWIAEFIPFFFKPLKFWWADRMILVCGYEERDGNIVVIYRPSRNTREHQLCASTHYLFWKRNIPPLHAVHEVLLRGKKGAMFAARLSKDNAANFFIRAKNSIRTVFSRTVEQRRNPTLFQASYFHAAKKPHLQFSWKNPADKDFWFSFLTVEDSNSVLISGIYTKKESWTFDEIKNLPYHIHDPQNTVLAPGKIYRAVVYAVNRFNWVTHIDALTFSP